MCLTYPEVKLIHYELNEISYIYIYEIPYLLRQKMQQLPGICDSRNNNNTPLNYKY